MVLSALAIIPLLTDLAYGLRRFGKSINVCRVVPHAEFALDSGN